MIQFTDLHKCIIRPVNNLIKKKKSKIHDKGIFATKDIQKNTAIMRFTDNINLQYFIYDDAYHVNHSSTNFNCKEKILKNSCEYTVLYSIKNIKKGEELLINYNHSGKIFNFGGTEFVEKKT